MPEPQGLTPGVLLLASQSPRRRELLARAQLPFVVVPAGPEGASDEADAGLRALAHARSKALGAATARLTGLVVGADTVVVENGACLGKPRDRAEARRFLSRLMGQEHEVLTAHAFVPAVAGRLLPDLLEARVERAVVAMRRLTPEELARYLDDDEWRDKAGGYGIQGAAGAFARLVSGELDTVIGLTVSRVRAAWRRWQDEGARRP